MAIALHFCPLSRKLLRAALLMPIFLKVEETQPSSWDVQGAGQAPAVCMADAVVNGAPEGPLGSSRTSSFGEGQ